jgi:site-specific DNA-methyltransferase (adenine-specific)
MSGRLRKLPQDGFANVHQKYNLHSEVVTLIMSEQKVIEGDCLEIMRGFADKSFDLVLTDPPYGIGEAAGKNKSRGKLAIAKDYGNESWDDEPPSKEYFDEMRRVSKNQIIFGGNYFADNLPASSCWLVWDKNNGANDFADCELAWTSLERAVRLFKYTWNGMIQEDMKHKERRAHPTQKPLELMKWCLSQVPDAVTILDPFMGSGTTLVAAKYLGRNATGIEISPKYCEIARNRLSQEMLF